MPRLLKKSLIVLGAALSGCGLSGKETVSTIDNGNYKISVISTESNNSGTINIDICVSFARDKKNPIHGEAAQCFFHGFDLSGLVVRWTSGDRIDVSFKNGYVSAFRNYAVIPNGLNPVEFRVFLHEGGSCSSRKAESAQRLPPNDVHYDHQRHGRHHDAGAGS